MQKSNRSPGVTQFIELDGGGASSMASGIALVEQRMITILDVDRVFPTPHNLDLDAAA